jgi:bifunctional non-homologous end joining protein LigD
MPKAYAFCIPTRGNNVPHTPDWLHEIKYDSYRLHVERDGDRVRLITRSG